MNEEIRIRNFTVCTYFQSDFWSDDDDELMRTALEDLSPKARRSVRQSLLFLSKRRSVAPKNQTPAAFKEGIYTLLYERAKVN